MMKEVKMILVITALMASSLETSTAKPRVSLDNNYTVDSSSIPQSRGAGYSHSPNLIPGTELKTRTSYKLGLKRFPKGVITWTQQGKGTFNYVQIDNNREHLPNYKPGGVWHQDSMWQFIPVLHQGQETGWYGLKNRAIREAYMTWSPNDFADSSQNAFHMILEKNHPGDRQEGDFFLKPVKVQNEGQTYYQLKLKRMPRGVVTWSQKKYEDKGSHYIELDNQPDEWHMMNYKEGGKWYDDTLFSIDEPEGETESDSDLGHLEQERQY